MRLLRKLISRFLTFFALTILSSALAPASQAHAFAYRGGFGGGGFVGGGFVGGGVMSGGAMTPFMGMPYYPGGNMMMTGQMGGFGGGYGGGVDMMPLYVSNSINWNGAQPMGYSYMPPIGLHAIGNSMTYNQIAPYMGQMYGGGGQSFGGSYGGYSGSARAF